VWCTVMPACLRPNACVQGADRWCKYCEQHRQRQ
jgi:hypothetical protein